MIIAGRRPARCELVVNFLLCFPPQPEYVYEEEEEEEAAADAQTEGRGEALHLD